MLDAAEPGTGQGSGLAMAQQRSGSSRCISWTARQSTLRRGNTTNRSAESFQHGDLAMIWRQRAKPRLAWTCSCFGGGELEPDMLGDRGQHVGEGQIRKCTRGEELGATVKGAVVMRGPVISLARTTWTFWGSHRTGSRCRRT